MNSEDEDSFGNLLARYRNQAHMSQQKLASCLGLSRGSIVKWEQGDSLPKDRTRVTEIARCLKLTEHQRNALLRAALLEIPFRDTPPQSSSHVLTGQTARIPLLDDYLSPDAMFERMHLEDFVGRTWLEKKLDDYLSEKRRDRGVWLLVGEAGIGKSSFLAHLVRERGYSHVFLGMTSGNAYLHLALKSLGAQLIQRFNLEQFVETNGSLRISTDSPDFLIHLLNAASKKLVPGEKLIIVIDALDEAGFVPGGNVLGLPKFLPHGVYLILSQRPTPLPIPLDIDPSPYRVNLQTSDKSNLNDILTYLHHVAATEPIAEQLVKKKQRVKKFVQILSQKSAGNWAYLHYIIDEIRQNQRELSDLASLPNGLIEYYAHFWDGWRQRPEWDSLYAPLLATLAAAFEPISLETLKAWAHVQEALFQLRRLLKENWSLFIYEQDETYRFYHATVREFLAGQPDLEMVQPSTSGLLDELRERRKEAHHWIATALFASALSGGWEEMTGAIRLYCLRYLLKHLSILGRVDDVYTLIETASWRKAKNELDPSRYSLAQDVELAIRLSQGALEEAISKRAPVQRVFSLLSPFCAHSLIYSLLKSTAANIPPELLGVLAHLGQTETALGYAELLNKREAYQYIAEGLEASGKVTEARNVRQQMADTILARVKSSKNSQSRDQKEPSIQSVRLLLKQENTDVALQVAEYILHDEERNQAISEVAMFLAENGREVDARTSASRITDPRSQVTCFASIAKILFESHREEGGAKYIDIAIKRIEAVQNPFEKVWAIITIIKALMPVIQSREESTIQRDLAIKLTHQAEELTWAIDDMVDQGRTFAGVAECFFDLGETHAGTVLIEQAWTMANDTLKDMSRIPRNRAGFPLDPMLFDGYPDSPTRVRILEELPHLFVRAGNSEKALEVMKQAIAEASRLGREAFAGRGVPEDIVRWMALNGPSDLVKQAAKEVLPSGLLESSLWLAAGSLVECERFDEALAFIEDGRIAAYRPGYEVREILTRAAAWLVRSNQFMRARRISELAIDYAQEVDQSQLARVFSGIASGLVQSHLPDAAQAAAAYALHASQSMPRPHAWLHLPDHVNALLEACSAEQACRVGEWIIEMTKKYWNFLEENEETGIREGWVKLSRLAAKSYATAGKIDQAIAAVDLFGEEYGRGRRYVHALGEIYVYSLSRAEINKTNELKKKMQEYANILLEDAEEFLSRDKYNAYWNGIMTDMLVTLARTGAASQALEKAKKIEDPYYRAGSLGTIIYESSPTGKEQEYVDIALNTLAYTKNLLGPIRSTLRLRAIKVLARCGRVDLAEKALKEFWFASEYEDKEHTENFEKSFQIYDGSILRCWDDTLALAQVLTEMIIYGSSWSAYVVADLFIKGHFHVWHEMAVTAPAFGTMNAANDLWERVRKLLIVQ